MPSDTTHINNTPNFLVVGAAKSGTTSLYGYLKQHWDIYLPEVKESRYFSNVKDKNINPFLNRKHATIVNASEEYYKLFNGVNKHTAIGEVSPDYLYYYKHSIKNIINELGNEVKILMILRNPVQRSYSNYLHIIRDGYDEYSLVQLIEKEKGWINNNIWWGFYIIDPGYYFKQVSAYLKNFNQVKIIIFEKYIQEPQSALKDICRFLNVDDNFNFREPHFINRTGVINNRILNHFLRKDYFFKNQIKYVLRLILGERKAIEFFQKLLESNLEKPELDLNSKQTLLNIYMDDINKLENLIDRDLSIWKK